MKTKINEDILFYTLGLLAILIYTLVITLSGKVNDADNYFIMYNYISEKGYIDFIVTQFTGYGKVEPGIYLIYSLFPSDLSFSSFVFFNYFIFLNTLFLLFKSILKYIDNKHYIKVTLIFLLLIFLWYPIYSNLLWVWRNIFAVLILIISIFYVYKFSKSILVILSISFHFSAIMYFPILFLANKIQFFLQELDNKRFLFFNIGFGLTSAIVINLFFDYFSFLASGNANWKEIGGTNYVGGIISLYLFFVLIPFITIRTKISDDKMNLYTLIFSVLLVFSGFSLVFLDNHFIVHRVFIFSSFLYVPFFLIFRQFLTYKLKMTTNFAVFLGILPTINSIFKYLYA